MYLVLNVSQPRRNPALTRRCFDGIVHVLALAAAVAALAAPAPGWQHVATGPAGGSVWVGRIPNRSVPGDHRPSAVYLPPGYSPDRRYPVVYLLHGMRGSPSSIWDGLRLPRVADGLISSGASPPFIAVMPVAGPTVDPSSGEWAGVWEDYVVRDVVPWTDTHLSTRADAASRALEGLCAGGYGALDIGLRHPTMFGTLGSWEGYPSPVFRDGPFVHASPAQLAAHDPALLVRRQGPALRRQDVRFILEYNGDHGAIRGAWSAAFGAELGALRLPHETRQFRSRAHYWRSMLPPGLRYAAAGFKTG